VTTLLETAPAPLPPRRRTSGRGVVSALIAAVLVAAIVVVGYWDIHPNLVQAYGNAEGGPVPLGHTQLANTWVLTSRGVPSNNASIQYVTVKIQSVRPIIVSNTSQATVRIELCRRNQSVGIGMVLGASLSPYCTAAVAPAHQSAALGVTSQLIAVITPHRPGKVVIDGFRMSYRDGIRRGTQTGGIKITSVTR
jgi:hypothetical protein